MAGPLTGETISFETEHIGKDGTRHPVRVTISPLKDKDGVTIGLVGVSQDTSAQKATERELQRISRRFESFMHYTPAMAYIKDRDGRMLYTNPVLSETFELTDEDIGKNDKEIWGEEAGAKLREHDKLVFAGDKGVRFEEEVPTPNGELRTFLSFKFPIDSEEGPALLGGLSIDITDQKYYEQQLESYQERLQSAITELESLNETDPLTKLGNRGKFDSMLQEAIARSECYTLPLSMIMLDIDSFKKFNDSFGHPEGDQVLIQLADLLNSVSRSSDTVARIGGEEFAIILPGTPMQGAIITAERLRKAVQNHTWDHRNVTISVGIAEWGDNCPKAASLCKQADIALYRSKAEGGNRVSTAPDNQLASVAVTTSAVTSAIYNAPSPDNRRSACAGRR